jgi:hypothetical protein
MNLIGVEFTDFACFQKRFVPLCPGVQILVGRNNAGKTAILRGLTALAGLPVTPLAKVDGGLAGYARDLSEPRAFGLRVWFSVDDDTWDVFSSTPHQIPFYNPATTRLVFDFRVFPTQNVMGLQSANLVTPDQQVEVISRATGLYNTNRIDSSATIRGQNQLRTIATRPSVGNFGSFPILDPTGAYDRRRGQPQIHQEATSHSQV